MYDCVKYLTPWIHDFLKDNKLMLLRINFTIYIISKISKLSVGKVSNITICIVCLVSYFEGSEKLDFHMVIDFLTVIQNKLLFQARNIFTSFITF